MSGTLSPGSAGSQSGIKGREKLDDPWAITLRRIPASLFGVLMSINPVFAALVGALALGEALGVVQGAGILLIAAANAALAAVTGPRKRTADADSRVLPGELTRS